MYHAQRHRDGIYYTVDEGLSEIVARLRKQSLATIYTHTKVVDVIREGGQYHLSIQHRRGDNDVVCTNITCNRLCLCLPPHCTTSWKIVQAHLLPQIHSVQTHPLHHIYATGNLGEPTHHKTKGLLSQVVSGDYQHQYFQISYSAGRIATFWHRLKLDDPARFKALLQSELRREGWNEVPVDGIKSFYWAHAVHSWVPMFQDPAVDRLVQQSIVPHPTALPHLYWAGEAFSSIQGWMEGALQTANMVLGMVTQDSSIPSKIRFPSEFVIVDGRILDVSEWKHVHPGSKAALEKRFGKNVDGLHILQSQSSTKVRPRGMEWYTHPLYKHRPWTTIECP